MGEASSFTEQHTGTSSGVAKHGMKDHACEPQFTADAMLDQSLQSLLESAADTLVQEGETDADMIVVGALEAVEDSFVTEAQVNMAETFVKSYVSSRLAERGCCPAGPDLVDAAETGRMLEARAKNAVHFTRSGKCVCRCGLPMEVVHTPPAAWTCDWIGHRGDEELHGAHQCYGCQSWETCDWLVCQTCLDKAEWISCCMENEHEAKRVHAATKAAAKKLGVLHNLSPVLETESEVDD